MQGPALPALAVALALISNPVAAAAGATMRSVRAGICTQPFTQCVKIDTVPRPRPAKGHALIAVNGSSVNPSDVDTLEAGGCIFGCGNDMAGTVVDWAPEFGGRIGFPPLERHGLVLSIEKGC